MATPPKCPSRLADRWVFWQDKWENVNGQMVQSLADLGETDTARGFWALFESNKVEALPDGSSLHVFKGSVKPEWEDPANVNGGHFRFTPLPDAANASPSRLWYQVLLGALGGQFTLSSSIVGIGFTAKKEHRKVVSVWVNTTDPSAVRTLQADLGTYSVDRFASKFVMHSTIPRSDFTAQEAVWHRRTKSAPSHYVSVDFDDDDEREGAAAAADGGAPALRRRNPPVPLDSGFAAEAQARADAHARSKSEGGSRDIVPHVAPLSTTATSTTRASKQSTPPPEAAGVQRTDTDWNWQDQQAAELRDSNSGVYPTMKAPTPLKEWADNWSPSLINAHGRPVDSTSSATSPGTGHAEGQSAAQAQQLAALGAPTNPATTAGDSPMNLSRTQPQGRMEAAAPQPPRAGTFTVQQPAEQPQPFGSFPLQMHRAQQQQQQQQPPPAGQPHPAGGVTMAVPLQPVQAQQPVTPPHTTATAVPTSSPGQYSIHNPYQLHSASQPYTQPVYSPPPSYPQNTTSQALPYVIVRQPVSHTSPQASDARAKRASRSPQEDRAVPLRQPDRSPPPRDTPGSRRSTPPPKSPPPGTVGSADRRVQHTKSDAPAFICRGWMYPSGLNRKERRRVMFSEEVAPGDFPGAVFLGEDKPDGPCTDDGTPLPKGEGDA